jgi:rhodanese-related sulfurtransferase
MSDVPTVRVDDLGPDATILDVRERDEWDAGHAQGALHVPATELMARYGEVPADRQVYVVCRTGGRSARVTAWLVDNGYEAANVAGGMGAWAESGRPLVSETQDEPYVM